MGTRLIGLLAIVAGLCFLIPVGFYIVRTQNLINNSLSTKGTVIETTFRTGNKRHTRNTKIKFQTPDGRSITFISPADYYSGKYQDGEIVDVIYNAQDPQDARLASFNGLWNFALGFGGLGSLLFIGGIALFLRK